MTHRDAPTLQDVADHAGVHPGTASRALDPTRRSMVNDRTARRILRAAKDLGYRPNSMARGLSTSVSSTIGVLIPDIANPFFPPILRGIEDTLARAGYTTLIGNTDGDAQRERSVYETFRTHQVDGLIAGTAWLHDELFDEAASAQIPVVLLNRRLVRADVSAVCSDDDVGIGLAVDHLVDLGHRSIAHLAGGLELSTGWTRHRAFSYAMQRHGLQAEPNLIAVCGTLSEDQGAQATLDLLDRGKPFTAVVAANDLIALGCLDALAQRGLTCPGEVSVVGYNDMRFADKLQPPLTTIRVPQYELGVEAARMLLDQLAGRLTGRTPPPRLSLLQPKLIVRGSTAPAPPPFIRAGN